MYYVYILQSLGFDQIYTGFTKNLKARIHNHNSGKSSHTKKFKPWKLVIYFAFEKQELALRFEKYLKTGLGVAFVRKHFL